MLAEDKTQEVFMISLKLHSLLDYLGAVFLLFTPAIFGFAHVPIAKSVFFNAGMSLIIYSLFTNYSFALFRLIPVSIHMLLDGILGIGLIFSPNIFGYSSSLTVGHKIAHITLGIAICAFVLLTRRQGTGAVRAMGDAGSERHYYDYNDESRRAG